MALICATGNLCKNPTTPQSFPLHNGNLKRVHPISVCKRFSTKPMRLRLKSRLVCSVYIDNTEEMQVVKANVGDRIRVKVPLKVYHVPKTPELDLVGMEGAVTDYLVMYKGKPISANLPYKVQFLLDLNGKSVKFFAHLKDDEFDVVG